MYSILYFDVEDSTSPPEAGSDDVVLWIAQRLAERKITGSFHVIGDKARSLEARGKRDVIDAVRAHDASSHYNHGSVHPTSTELIAPAGWHEGVRIALREEAPGFRDIERIFGRCAALTRHGGSYSPQAVHAAGREGKVFYGTPFYPPGHRAFWMAGTLCLSIAGLVMHPSGAGGTSLFEPVYEDGAAFEKQLRAFEDDLRQTARRWEFTSLFGAHPHRLNTTKFSCFNHYGGMTRSPLIPPPQRPAEQKATIRKNFVRFAAFVAQAKDVRIMGLTEIAKIFGSPPTTMTAEDLGRYAAAVMRTGDVPLDERFSPAELLVGLAEAIIHQHKTGSLPATTAARNVIGPPGLSERDAAVPTDDPISLDLSRLAAVAGDLVRHVETAGMLPTHCGAAGDRLAIGALLSALAQAYDDLAADAGSGPWRATPRAPYPLVADGWRSTVTSLAQWRVFRPDFDMSLIADLTCWQAWSIKPARAENR